MSEAPPILTTDLETVATELRRTAIGPFRVENAGEELPAARVAEMVPAVGMALR